MVVYLHVGREACLQAVAEDGGLLARLEWLHGDEGAKALQVGGAVALKECPLQHVEARIDIGSLLHRVGEDVEELGCHIRRRAATR